MKLKTSIGAAVVALALAAPGQALAQDPVQDGYGGGGGGVLSDVSGGGGTTPGGGTGDDTGTPTTRTTTESGAGSPTTTASAGGSLPFTGLDLGLLVGGGLSMLGLGVALRRVSRTTA